MLIVDTGPLLATADRSDPDHVVCLALLEAHPGPLVTTPLVATETGWLIRRELGTSAETTFYTSIVNGEISSRTSPSRIGLGSPSSSALTATSDSTRPTPA